MTLDLAKLKETAEKVRAARTALIADQDSQDAVNAYDQSVEDWCELANPATILALIERLESAEGALKLIKGETRGCAHDMGFDRELGPLGCALGDRCVCAPVHMAASDHLDKHNATP